LGKTAPDDSPIPLITLFRMILVDLEDALDEFFRLMVWSDLSEEEEGHVNEKQHHEFEDGVLFTLQR
jgi:hypothetical protein